MIVERRAFSEMNNLGKLYRYLVLTAFLSFAATSASASTVIATFENLQGSILEFVGDAVSGDGELITGPGAANIALSDVINSIEFLDASFTLTDTLGGVLDISGLDAEAGVITFINDSAPLSADPILTIEFSTAALSSTDFSATETPFFFVDTAAIISIGGSIVDGLIVTDEEFSFALNATPTEDGVSFTGAFTAAGSTAVVPVPAALPLLLSGLMGGWLVGRRKRA